jgi:dipeptidyl aminopeptidase/acylaminoacyl peptidase
MTIERRRTMPRTAYQPWPKYGAPTGAAYRASEVRIPTSAGHVLAGTLTLPTRPAPGKVSAVLLITGSGKNERNQGNSPSMPFRQLADALSRRGIAVLRVDDRGVGGSTGVWGTTLDEAADVRSALAYLRARPDIDRSRLALLGWSEGGMIAPVVAADDPEIRALILMCAPADGQETAEYQVRYAVEQSPAVPPEARERVIAETLAAAGDSPRARSMLSLDTSAHAQQVRAPVLLLHGGNDRHVPSHSTAKLAAAFGSAGSEVTMRVFPNLNHVFLPDPDGRAGAWAFLPSARVPSEVLDTVADWAAARLTPRPAQTLRPAA